MVEGNVQLLAQVHETTQGEYATFGPKSIKFGRNLQLLDQIHERIREKMQLLVLVKVAKKQEH